MTKVAPPTKRKPILTFVRLLGVAALALPALSGAARAGGCSNATLQGVYAFDGTNYTRSIVFNGIRDYDGNGHFTQRDYQGNSVPAEFAPPGQETGSYQVNSDCTGSAALDLNVPVPEGSTGFITTLFVISDGGRHVHEVVSQLTPPGSTTGPVPAQTSVDVWKVAPEQQQ